MTDENNLKRRFGLTVRQYRQNQEMSQGALGERATMQRTYIADIERGVRNVSLTNVARLAEALGVSLSAFFGKMDRVKLPEPVRAAGRGKKR